jgi:signal transduction histidine kinase
MLVLDAIVAEQLLPSLAHDLRNPLNSMHLVIELLSRLSQVAINEGFPEKLAQLVSRLKGEVTRLSDTLLLLPQYWPSTDAEAAAEHYELGSLVRESLGAMGYSMRTRQIQCISELPVECVPLQSEPSQARLIVLSVLVYILNRLENGTSLRVRIEWRGAAAVVILDHTRESLREGASLGQLPTWRSHILLEALRSLLNNRGGRLDITAGETECQYTLLLHSH